MKHLLEVGIKKDRRTVKLLVNVEDISSLQESPNSSSYKCYIEFKSGEYVSVMETYEVVKDKIEKARKQVMMYELMQSALTGLSSNLSEFIKSKTEEGKVSIDFDLLAETAVDISKSAYWKIK